MNAMQGWGIGFIMGGCYAAWVVPWLHRKIDEWQERRRLERDAA